MLNSAQVVEYHLAYNERNYKALGQNLKTELRFGYDVIEPNFKPNGKKGVMRNAAGRSAMHEVTFDWQNDKLLVEYPDDSNFSRPGSGQNKFYEVEAAIKKCGGVRRQRVK